MAKVIEANPFKRAVHELNTNGTRSNGKRSHGDLPSSDVVKARVAEVVRVLLDGKLSIDILDWIRQREADPDSPFYIAAAGKPVTYNTARRYVMRAQKLIRDIAAGEHEQLLARHIAQRRALFCKSVEAGDRRAALAVLDSEAHLLGLFPDRHVVAAAVSGGVNLQVLVQAVIQAESTRTLEAVEVKAVPQLTNGDSDAAQESSTAGGRRDPALVT